MLLLSQLVERTDVGNGPPLSQPERITWAVRAIGALFVVSATIYAKRGADLWISTKSGSTWTARTISNGLAGYDAYDVFIGIAQFAPSAGNGYFENGKGKEHEPE
jgi:hypothetical protein